MPHHDPSSRVSFGLVLSVMSSESIGKLHMEKPQKYYAVARGMKPGVYHDWFGPEGAEAQVRGYSGAVYKGFSSLGEAKQWLKNPIPAGSGSKKGALLERTAPSSEKIVIHTDGSCRGNPGPGGYGVVIVRGAKRIELSEGFRLTTNNRMELMACIAALKALGTPSDVILYSDSRYVVNAINKGWARKWRTNQWMRTRTEAAENIDLWDQLLDLCDQYQVQFIWVHGHAGHSENERCDELATAATQGEELKEDHLYIQGRTRISKPLQHKEG
jgi:ribonuclease HI